MTNKKSYYMLAFCGMLMMGFIDSLRGPLIPDIRSTFGIDYSSIGVMLFVSGLGFLVSTFIGGLMCDRLGQKKVLLFGFVCVAAAITGISYSMGFVMFLLMMWFLNIGLGSIEIGINSLVTLIVVKNQAVLMNLLHFFYGLGASIGPRYSGRLLSAGISWNTIYIYSLGIVAALFAYLVFVKIHGSVVHESHQRLHLMEILKDKRVVLFGAVLGFYVSAELGVSNWFVNYLTVVYRMDEIKSATFLSVFFITFTVGRLVGGFIAEKIGYLKSVLIFMAVSLMLFTSGWLLGEKYVFLISLCGLSFSIVFPTMVSAVIKEFKKSTSSVLGFVVTSGSGISMLSNWLIGMLNDSLSVQTGFMVISIYIAIVIALVWILKHMHKAGE